MIALARPDDLERLRDIERAAGRMFAEIGMQAVADDEPPPVEALLTYQRDGRAWVYIDDGRPVAYLIADIVDGNAHIEQVSVHPDHARKRLGRALIEHLADWARTHRCAAITLTTFTEVRFNGPYYETCGFGYVPEAELTPGLRRIRAAEAEYGLDQWPRACMRRAL